MGGAIGAYHDKNVIRGAVLGAGVMGLLSQKLLERPEITAKREADKMLAEAHPDVAKKHFRKRLAMDFIKGVSSFALLMVGCFIYTALFG